MVDYQFQDTIFAPITATGRGGAVCVWRISGRAAIASLDRCVSLVLSEVASRQAVFTTLASPEGEKIDEVLLTIYRAPKSYTGEDTVELSCHNSPFIADRLGRLFCALGLRMAYPGEFSRRAVLGGKLTLAQAEATVDLIEARSEAQHRLALQQLKGGLSEKLKHLRQTLIEFAALIELELDFAEEDVHFAERDRLKASLADTQREVSQLLDSFAQGAAIKEGIPIAIVGKPNAGKSTLLNALLEEERALVSDIAGTTRDFIEGTLILDGVLYRIIDTAGLRDTDQPLEKEGIKRTWDKVQTASLLIHIFDLTQTDEAAFQKERQELEAQTPQATRILSVANKIDQWSDVDEPLSLWVRQATSCQISAQSRQHLGQLKQQITQSVGVETLPQTLMLTNQRHYEHLYHTQKHLDKVSEGLSLGVSSEFIASDLRSAAQELAAITGAITHEDVLDEIFSRFCIGK